MFRDLRKGPLLLSWAECGLLSRKNSRQAKPRATPFDVRKNACVSKAFVVLFGLGVVATALVPACSSDAVGVEACRKIETARCRAITACTFSDSESAYCVAFYQDQCLHGLAKSGADPSDAVVTACVEAIQVVESCARQGISSMSECPSVGIIANANPAVTTPCTIINRQPELLDACAFLTPGADTGSTMPLPDASMDDGGMSDADAMVN